MGTNLSKLTSFRTTDEIRDKLNEAAKARGVSVNQEINDRIAASFDRQPERIFANPGLSGLMKLVRVAMQGAGQRAAFLKKGYFGLDPKSMSTTPGSGFTIPTHSTRQNGRSKRSWKRAGRQAAQNRRHTRRPTLSPGCAALGTNMSANSSPKSVRMHRQPR